MKRSLLLLINLVSYVSPSLAVLDDLLVEKYYDPEEKTWLRYKDLVSKNPQDPRSSDERYKGRSQINNHSHPKLPVIHTYNYGHAKTPFAAALPQARPPQTLKDLLAHQLPDYQVVYSFTVQLLQPNMSLPASPGYPASSPDDPFALKPHYFVHPEAPYAYAGRDYVTHLKWTVVPGVEGHIEPAAGAGLHSDAVHTHRTGGPDGRMGVSADVMHLKGIEKIHRPEHLASNKDALTKHHDVYSLVAFTDDDGKKIVAVTYHWLLTVRDWKENGRKFETVLKKANTFRELIDGRPQEFEGIGAHAPFTNLVGELKRYVDFSLKEVPLPAPQLPVLEKPVPQKQKEPVLAPQQPAMKEPVPQKQVSASPSKKPVLQPKTASVRTNAKTAPARTNAKTQPLRKAVAAAIRSVIQKPVGQSKTPAPTVKAAPKVITPVKKVLSSAAKKAGVLVKKTLASKPAPKKTGVPVKTILNPGIKKVAVPVKTILSPGIKKVGVLAKKPLASKAAAKKASVQKATPKKKVPTPKGRPRKASVHKSAPARTKAIRSRIKG